MSPAFRAGLFFALSVGTVLLPKLSGAQPPVLSQDSAAQLARNEEICREYAPRLARETRSDSVQLALNGFSKCPIAGPPALAARWRNAPDDSLRLFYLVHASTRIRDERVLEAALDVVADRTQPRPTRFAAIKVLWYYVNRLEPVFGTALLGLPTPRVIVGVGAHNLAPITGSQPVVGDPRQRILATLAPLTEITTDDPQVLMALRETIAELRVVRGRERRSAGPFHQP
jgi:hypothetical protein